HSVSVLINLGAGVFAPAVEHVVGLFPLGLALVDLDGDGGLDIAAALSAANAIGVLRSLGGGSFAPVQQHGVGWGPENIAAGDLTSDGRADLVVLCTDNGNALTVCINRGPSGGLPWTNLGYGVAGAAGVPALQGTGPLTPGSGGTLTLSEAAPSALSLLFASLDVGADPHWCGLLVPSLGGIHPAVVTGASGSVPLTWHSFPAGLSGQRLWIQWVVQDAGADCGVAFSNALRATVP
ncbi:MAG TPA: VCBS repeat-containing protein, partial [Planctomycetota bacterium]|nr:VCBS repeat-containing protein [Planctomycetota bacterium]